MSMSQNQANISIFQPQEKIINLSVGAPVQKNVNISVEEHAQKNVGISINTPQQRNVNIQVNTSNRVISVNGKIGNVVLSGNDIGLGNVENISILSASGYLQAKINDVNPTSGQFYLNSNPSGYITGVNLSGYIKETQTGAFYAASNPSGYITGVNLSAYALNADTGSFVTVGQTGAFYAASNPSGYITGTFSLDNNGYKVFLDENGRLNFPTSGVLADTVGDGGITLLSPSGSYAEIASYDGNVYAWASDINYENPVGGGFSIGTDTTSLTGGYVWTFGNDGLFHFPDGSVQSGAYEEINLSLYTLNADTGNFVTNAQTGRFYLASNPSGYITGVDLSSYYPNNNPSGFIAVPLPFEESFHISFTDTALGLTNLVAFRSEGNQYGPIFYCPPDYITFTRYEHYRFIIENDKNWTFQRGDDGYDEEQGPYISWSTIAYIFYDFDDIAYPSPEPIPNVNANINFRWVANSIGYFSLTTSKIDYALPKSLGSGNRGQGQQAALWDHVHPLPTTEQLGAASVSGLSATGSNLSTRIGLISGSLSGYYPRTNPSGYITTGNTGNFYPRTNPSGYITGVDISTYLTYNSFFMGFKTPFFDTPVYNYTSGNLSSVSLFSGGTGGSLTASVNLSYSGANLTGKLLLNNSSVIINTIKYAYSGNNLISKTLT